MCEAGHPQPQPSAFRRGLLCRWYVGTLAIVRAPWGCETSDSRRFYSLEYSDTSRIQESRNGEAFVVRDSIGIGGGRLNIRHRTMRHDATCWVQETCFSARSDASLVDLVTRVRFPRDAFEGAKIAGTRVDRDASEYYHQYATDHLALEGRHPATITFRAVAPPQWKKVLYVKSTAGEWIVHGRLLPAIEDDWVLKVRGHPAPRPVSRFVQARDRLKRYLEYAGEYRRYPGSRSFQGFPLALLESGQKAVLRLEVRVVPGG